MFVFISIRIYTVLQSENLKSQTTEIDANNQVIAKIVFDLSKIVGSQEIVKLIFEASSPEAVLRIVKGELMGCVHEGM